MISNAMRKIVVGWMIGFQMDVRAMVPSRPLCAVTVVVAPFSFSSCCNNTRLEEDDKDGASKRERKLCSVYNVSNATSAPSKVQERTTARKTCDFTGEGRSIASFARARERKKSVIQDSAYFFCI